MIVAAICLGFWFTEHGALDVYYWIAVQGVIWIVLVQALTSLSVWAYFRREHPASSTGGRPRGAVDRVPGPDLVLYLCYEYLERARLGDVLYVKELGSAPGSRARQFEDITWLGIIGVLVPVAGLAYAYYLRSSNRARVRDGRSVHQRGGDLASRVRGGGAPARAPPPQAKAPERGGATIGERL